MADSDNALDRQEEHGLTRSHIFARVEAEGFLYLVESDDAPIYYYSRDLLLWDVYDAAGGTRVRAPLWCLHALLLAGASPRLGQQTIQTLTQADVHLLWSECALVAYNNFADAACAALACLARKALASCCTQMHVPLRSVLSSCTQLSRMRMACMVRRLHLDARPVRCRARW